MNESNYWYQYNNMSNINLNAQKLSGPKKQQLNLEQNPVNPVGHQDSTETLDDENGSQTDFQETHIKKIIRDSDFSAYQLLEVLKVRRTQLLETTNASLRAHLKIIQETLNQLYKEQGFYEQQDELAQNYSETDLDSDASVSQNLDYIQEENSCDQENQYNSNDDKHQSQAIKNIAGFIKNDLYEQQESIKNFSNNGNLNIKHQRNSTVAPQYLIKRSTFEQKKTGDLEFKKSNKSQQNNLGIYYGNQDQNSQNHSRKISIIQFSGSQKGKQNKNLLKL
ncbi:hypothetical protein PPERSA_04931 [Pseudocohnilembus persalinus]|uniref:Uncharacterized protein n=1 Tax=Pseudocohnilembus persalinus TaxID=266149 RepID=A0A0V0R8D4_PSEPJ|nr:hypothetical protein PPERSA_04931 [Pseudocohnilembus persalinus]|eukprot:KRX10764.1 hypothetical protein PPERSA_04931 [Pseudocohnilembus persalinus]